MTTDKPIELNDAISRLLKSGVVKVTFGQRQQDKLIQCSAEQVMNEGAQYFMHNAADSTAEEALRPIIRSVEHCAELQAVIVKMPRNGK